jgi:hypothetical protein
MQRMNDFYINPLSVNEQCHSSNEVLALVKNLVECFKYLEPAIKKERIKLLYDCSIESRQFVTNNHFLASINDLPKDDPDIKKSWFLYTRNRALTISQSLVATTISSAYRPKTVEGIISEDSLIQKAHWISFGKNVLNESPEFNVSQTGYQQFTVKNVHHCESLKQLLPSYESSEKHYKTSYYDHQRGEQVAAMPLEPEQAQELLLTAIAENNDLFAYHQGSGKFYRFKLTHPDQNIYHGFQIEKEEISEELIKNCMT